MFVPLSHPPGHAQADFGEADAIIAGIKHRAHFFVMTLPHSAHNGFLVTIPWTMPKGDFGMNTDGGFS